MTEQDMQHIYDGLRKILDTLSDPQPGKRNADRARGEACPACGARMVVLHFYLRPSRVLIGCENVDCRWAWDSAQPERSEPSSATSSTPKEEENPDRPWPRIDQVSHATWSLQLGPTATRRFFQTEAEAKQHARDMAQAMNEYVPPAKKDA